jgi:c(7)-type cytochrome triheme protein
MRFQVSVRVALFAALLLYPLPGPVEAGGRLPALSYRGGGQGKVIFDHQQHASKGLLCNGCHTDFPGDGKAAFCSAETRAHHLCRAQTGTKCFACHNGKGAFDACDRCHYKIGSLFGSNHGMSGDHGARLGAKGLPRTGTADNFLPTPLRRAPPA